MCRPTSAATTPTSVTVGKSSPFAIICVPTRCRPRRRTRRACARDRRRASSYRCPCAQRAPRKEPANFFDDALRADAELPNRVRPAFWARAGSALIVAVVAAQQPFAAVNRERNAAARAVRRTSTARHSKEFALPRRLTKASSFRGAAAARPSPARARAQDAAVAAFELFAHVDDVHVGQGLRGGARVQLQMCDPAAFRGGVPLQRRRRAPEQQDAAFAAASARARPRPRCSAARLPACTMVRVLRPRSTAARGRAERTPRCARRRPRRSRRARSLPRIETLAFRERGMQHRDALAEGGLEAPRRLRRERDLGNQHDRSPAARTTRAIASK